MTLKRRLDRLESLAEADELHFVFITHYEAGDDDPQCKAGETFKVIVFSKPGCPAQLFGRLPGETEDELLLRAGVPKKGG
jgi:hypothetical protein